MPKPTQMATRVWELFSDKDFQLSRAHMSILSLSRSYTAGSITRCHPLQSSSVARIPAQECEERMPPGASAGMLLSSWMRA